MATNFFVEALGGAGAAGDGSLCVVELENPEGEVLTLCFPAGSASKLAHKIVIAGQAAAGVVVKMGDTTAAIVREIEVCSSLDGSVVGLTLLSGEVRTNYALTPNLSAHLRRRLKAAEDESKGRRDGSVARSAPETFA